MVYLTGARGPNPRSHDDPYVRAANLLSPLLPVYVSSRIHDWKPIAEFDTRDLHRVPATVDLLQLSHAELVVCLFLGGVSLESCFELGVAWSLKIPTVIVCPDAADPHCLSILVEGWTQVVTNIEQLPATVGDFLSSRIM